MLTTRYIVRAKRHTHSKNLKVKSDVLTIVFMYCSSNYIQTGSKLHFDMDIIHHTSGRGVVFSVLNVRQEWFYLKTGSANLMERTRYFAHKMTSPIAALCVFNAVTNQSDTSRRPHHSYLEKQFSGWNNRVWTVALVRGSSYYYYYYY
jgi:hypothetical protein